MASTEKSVKLTKAQRQFVQACGDGVLAFCDADMRVHAGLLNRWIIAITYGGGHDGVGGYCLTPTGRLALAQSGGE